MSGLEVRPIEAAEVSEQPHQAVEQDLEDGTLEPAAFVEKSGDYRQSEAIQRNFIAVVDNITSQTEANVQDSGSEQAATTRAVENVDAKIIQSALPETTPPSGRATTAGGMSSETISSVPQIPSDAFQKEVYCIPNVTCASSVNLSGFKVNSLESPSSGSTPETAITGTPQGITSSAVDGSDQSKEGEENWTPPDVYVYVDANGKIIVVDKNGDPVDNPPVVQESIDNKGNVIYIGHYPGMDSSETFEIPGYSSSLEGMYVGYDENGNLTVFDKNGQPVESPPLIKMGVSPDGQVTYYAYYPGSSTGVELGTYSTSLEGCFAIAGQDGKITIVDANSNPLPCQPVVTKFTDEKGQEHYLANYPGSPANSAVEVPGYSTSLSGCYANVDSDGKVTIVDSDGNPLPSQPIITKYVDAGGKVHYSASYPGAGSQDGVDVPGYSTSLAGCSASIDQNGKVIVVDENGKPLSCQPLITKYVESRGQEYISACYPGDPSGAKTTLGWYTPSGSSTSN